mmetsp:Transcript_13133/g.14362  ORF Transcript_13133/g.14362 Transcript_13133/m.14362 type:complete len:109 (-) Transcript_13133:151-477(-)
MMQQNSWIALMLLIGIHRMHAWMPTTETRRKPFLTRTMPCRNHHPLGMSTLPTDDELLPADSTEEQKEDIVASFFNMECDDDDEEGCEIDWDQMPGFFDDESETMGEG